MIVLDYEANAGYAGLRETLPAFLDNLRLAHPKVPIVVLSQIPFARERFDAQQRQIRMDSVAFQRRLVKDRRGRGDLNLHFVNGGRLLGRTVSRSIVKCLTGKDLDTKYGRLSPPIHLYCFNLSTLTRLLDEVGLQVLHSLRPAQGHPVWFPQLSRYRRNPLEVLFRSLDDLGGRLDRGEVLVVFARKPIAKA